MPYHHFKIPCDEGAAAEAELNRFLAGKAVLAVDRHFVTDVRGAFWAYCVQVAPPGGGAAAVPGSAGKGVDYRDILEPEEFARYAKLREWRKERAHRDGCPPFAILSNEQLAEICRRPVVTLEELGQIAGIGKGRLERYGAAILDAVKTMNEPAK